MQKALFVGLALALALGAAQASWAAESVPPSPKAASAAEAAPPPAARETVPAPTPKEAPAAPKTPARPPADAPEAPPPKATDRPHAFEDLKAIYDAADLIVMFEVAGVQARTEVSTPLPWEVSATLMEVIKGKTEPGKIFVHVESTSKVFDLTRTELAKKQFVAALRPLADITQRRFQVVGVYAFPADGKEAQVFRQLAEADATRGSGGEGLQLQVRLIVGHTDKVFPVDSAKPVEIILTNTGKESATYLQAPIVERDGKLYLTGEGRFRLLDASGRAVPDKGTVLTGQVPPGQPTPALVLPQANFKETVDLAKHYNLSAGRYTLAVMLAPPTGKGRIVSNGLSFQVGAVNLPEAAPTKETPAAVAPQPAPASGNTVPAPPAKEAPKLPEPASYQPGQMVLGLAGLLRPNKSTYTLGEPIDLEFRLISRGQRTMAIDARLERTFTLAVKPVGESPEPLVIRQIIAWPADAQGLPTQRAYLREGAFWGQTLNLNMIKSREEIAAPTPEEIASGKDLSYERYGQTLFGFPKAGVYQVTATYKVPKPKPPADNPGAAPPTDWWFGELVTNPITIQVVEPPQPRLP
jgi:hypothetical protein